RGRGAMISIQAVEKVFGKIKALDGVSCEFRDGEITGLLGLNGAGKTTLMRLIYGLQRPDAGRVLVDGVNVQNNPEAVRRCLGVLPDDVGLYKRLSARENIEYFGRLQGLNPQQLRDNTDELVQLLNMQPIE